MTYIPAEDLYQNRNRTVAKSFYRQLKSEGFTHQQIIELSTRLLDLVGEVDCSACGGNRLRPDVAAVGSRAIPSDRSAPCHSMKHSGCRARRNSVATRRRSPETCCAKRPAG